MIENPRGLLAQTPKELRAKFEPEVALHTDKIEIVAGTGSLPLSRKIASLIDKKLGEPIVVFADGEKKVKKVESNLRKKGVFIIQSMHPSPDEKIWEFFLMVDAARRASATDIAGVLLYPPYMRQDWKDESRAPISATLFPRIAEFLGVNRILSMELHSNPQQGFFSGPWDIVPSNFVTIPEIKKRNLPNLAIAAADAGGKKRARNYSRALGLGDEIIQGDKDHPVTKLNQTSLRGLTGQIEGKDIVIVEDIIDTFGTVDNAAKMLHALGANSIRVVAPYGLFSTDDKGRKAIDKIYDSPIDEVITTNAIEPKQDAIVSGKVTYLDVAPLFAEAMLCMHTGESISERLIFDGRK
jgi:ribose-phosphate pyrophosphokinase